MSTKFLVLISAVVGILMISTKSTASLIVREDKEIQSLADGINEDSAAPPNLETAIKFEDELLLDGPMVKLSPEEVVIEVDKILETLIGEDGATNKTEDFAANQPQEKPDVAPERPIVNQDQDLNPSVTNDHFKMTNDRLSTTDGRPFEVSDSSTQITTQGLSDTRMEFEKENETTLGLEKLIPETKIDPNSPMKKHVDSLSDLKEEPGSVEDSRPEEILEIKYIMSDFEPYLKPGPRQHGVDDDSDDQVPLISIDMTPLPVLKQRGKSVKKDLGSKVPQSQLTLEQSEQKGGEHAPNFTTATSTASVSMPPSTSQGFEVPETIHESLTMPLKIQEILPSMNLSESKGSAKIENVSLSTSVAQAKPSPFYFLTGPFIIQGDTVRPYVGKKHDGAPSTYFLNVPGEDADVPPFNEAQAQLIAEA